MNEERLLAYLSLIRELLNCPSGEKNQILNQHLELLDGAFVQLCEQLAEELQSDGVENNAGFLRNLAQRVRKYLNSQAQPTSNQYLPIWLEILNAERESHSDPKVVYPILKKHQNQLDLNFAETLTQWFQSALDPNDSERNQALASLLNDFAADIQQFPLGSRADNLEIAIASYEAALEVYTRTAFPENWATTQNNLAAAYSVHIRGERAENLERAIKYYEAALEVRTRTAFPQDWAGTQNNLAAAYSVRIRGERAENLERAIKYYEAALEVYTRTAFPENWAMTQNNLANAYGNRIRGERAENLERAIASSKAALEVYTRTAFPQNWAMTQNNLANAYGNRIRGERAENLERAIKYYEAALEVYTPAAFPEKWAMTQNNLANAYSDRIRGERAENLERAIEFYQSALEVRTRNAFPQNHTETLNNLGLTYQNQSRYYTSDPEKKQTALQNAYNAFEQALDTVEFLRGEITSGDEAKRKLNEEYNRIYRGIVEVCLELGNYTAAIEYVDRSKARNLVELIATRDAYPQGVIPPKISQRLQYLRNAIAEEDRRLKQDPNPDYTHISQMREERQQLEPYKPLQFNQIQQLLDEETAILEWYILPDKFLTFTLTAQTLNLWTSSEEDLDKLIDWTTQYRNAYYQAKEALQVALKALKAAKTEQEQQKAQELLIRAQAQAQDIWQNPLAQRLETLAEILHLPEILQNLLKEFPNCKKLILIPHRYLHLFPLHALPIPIGESEVKSLQELFEKGVTYAPNCQLLQQAQTRHRPNFKRLFAVQNPTKDLSYADLQVETIRRLFPDRSSLQKHNATKANFLAKDLRQTHHLLFSCHAGFNPESPLNSGLLLAHDEILTLEEIIASLNLSQCSLVTLSACETGQVAIDTTDEYISLSSGFILAGSPSVLVSLWSVDEVSTALLLIKTYETLQNHPGQLAIALKTAQIWLRDTTVKGFQDWVQECPLLKVVEYWQERLAEFFRKLGQNEKGVNDRPYQSPYHWAAFCVVGQGEQKMASDSDKIQAFTDLLSNNLLANYWPDLEEFKRQLGDDDEKNAEAIEQWLNTDQRQSILTAYQEQLKSITSINPLLGVTGEKAIGGSKPKPKTLKEQIEEKLTDNSIKDNTNPKNPEENPPQS
ncbi:CHAT domain-containing protein [Planktothrix agardhii]|uniref:CHAT domain-containing protein n=1 Tax=Planktothrix agardhii TaxID=1160 RepID=UPI001F16FCDC|nr:CHAT domain-containing protein [Planktothrix agardhii]MCF3570059.1 CHAT domain-containing protein [Planktothrix agardhii 1805]